LLPLPYFHVVFTLPAAAAEIAFQNTRVVYAILFRAAADAMRDVAAEPRHLGAEIGAVAVPHSRGQTMTYHPHLHRIVPAGGLSPDQTRWVACRPSFFPPVRVLSRRFREAMVVRLWAAFVGDELRFSGALAALAEPPVLAERVAGLIGVEWVVYAKPPFAGPEPVLAYLGRYTHRVAIANSRLTQLTGDEVAFTWKDYRDSGKTKAITLNADEFIRRFLLHTVPYGFHRSGHFGFLSKGHRAEKLALCRTLLAVPTPEPPGTEPYRQRVHWLTGHAIDVCPDCGGTMLERGPLQRRPPPRLPLWCDSS
jgi:Putative transposase